MGDGKMVIKGDVINLSKEEIEKIIDKECKERLDMSLKEFLNKRQHSELPKSIAVHDIDVLLKLV